jgi:hypothetical protein
MSFLRGWPFDQIASAAGLGYIGVKYSHPGMPVSADVPAGFSGKSMTVWENNRIVCELPSDQSGKDVYLWIALKLNTSRSGALFWLGNSLNIDAQAQLTVRYDSTIQRLMLYRGYTLLQSGSINFIYNTWNIIQAKAKVHDSTGLFDLYLNNAPTADISVSDVNTQNSGNDSVLCLGVGGDVTVGSPDMLVYRPIVVNGDGAKNNGMIPYNLRHEILLPDSDGASIWTPDTGDVMYSRINSQQGSPDDASYGKADTLNDTNKVGVSNPAGPIDTVSALQVSSRAARQSASAAGVTFGIDVGGDVQQAVERFLPAAYANYIDVFETKSGGSDFSAADLSSVQLTSELTTVS